jgi:hypothetical protein
MRGAMLGGWLGLGLGVPALALIGGYARRFIRKNAPFYGVQNILVVGLAFGLGVALIVHFLVGKNSVAALIVLLIWGLLSNLYLGYEPDPIDWAKKSQQVGIVGAAAYVLVSFGLLFL